MVKVMTEEADPKLDEAIAKEQLNTTKRSQTAKKDHWRNRSTPECR